jgi:hypothetical protein
VTEYPLLCINPTCRKPDEGGPRRAFNAWFCPPCIDNTTRQLGDIADAWDDLEEALLHSETGRDGEQGKTKNAGKGATGIVINERAVHARTKASALIWFLIRDILDRYDDAQRTLTLPDDQTTPSLYRWLARWHVNGFATHPGDEFAIEVFIDISRARRDVRAAAYPSGMRKVKTGLPCIEHYTSVEGERVTCPGSLNAWIGPDTKGVPELVCSEDRQHVVDPETWRRDALTKASFDPAAMSRLANVLTG